MRFAAGESTVFTNLSSYQLFSHPYSSTSYKCTEIPDRHRSAALNAALNSEDGNSLKTLILQHSSALQRVYVKSYTTI